MEFKVTYASASNWLSSRYQRKYKRRLLQFRERLAQRVEIDDGSSRLRFHCETVRDLNRALTVFSKEPGTVTWIDSDFKPGQVFFDIGANIGVYSILAARRILPSGRVYAFEPHVANHACLLRNIILNNLAEVVVPCSFALHAKEMFSNFSYESISSGVSNSQFDTDRNRSAHVEPFVIRELKYGTSIDRLIESSLLPYPHHVKIDVDGNEHLILQGMLNLLSHLHAPLTVQVEIDDSPLSEVVAFFHRLDYDLDARHHSRPPKRPAAHLKPGYVPKCNAIFRLRTWRG